MISILAKNGKSLYEHKIDVLFEILKDVQLELINVKCGECGVKDSLVRYCRYVRFVTFILNGIVVTERLELYRYKCSVCGRTHVVIPGTQVIPYGRYSLEFILHVLMEHIERKITVQEITEKYQISTSTIYEWKKKFEKHYELMEGKLKALERGFNNSVEDIYNDTQISSRLLEFITQYEFGFLQKRREKKEETTYSFKLTGHLVFYPRGSP